MVQNTAARVLCKVRKFDHITPTLKQLHWLPVSYRIKFKICVLTFNALHNNGPTYLSDMLCIKKSQYRLLSTHVLTLDVPATKRKTLGDRAFKVAAPKLWNSLPNDMRSIDKLSQIWTENLLLFSILVDLCMSELQSAVEYFVINMALYKNNDWLIDTRDKF